MRKASLAIILLLIIIDLSAQITPSSGNYTTSDGYYTIQILFEDNKLVVVEPNKRSEYVLLGGNVYGFTNPTNNIEYRMEVMDEKTITSFKPATPDNRTKLIYSGLTADIGEEEYEEFSELAQKYLDMIESDPANTQAWTFCAGLAVVKGSMNEEGFAAQAGAVVQSLKLIVTDQSKCPCPDVIPANVWSSN